MSRRSAVAAMVALVGGLLVMAGPASAQTGYPPGPCPVTISAANAGNFNVGVTFTVTMAPTCVWTPGAPVVVSVNGVLVDTKPALVNGTVQVTVRVVSSTLLEIDDPVPVAAICGVNSIVATGPSAVARANVTHTVNFGVICPATAVRSGGIAFTGANIIKLAAGALVAVLFGSILVTSARKRRRVAQSV